MRSFVKKLIDNPKKTNFIICGLLILFFTASYAVLTLHRYWQFEYFFYDNAYFHTALWKLSRFESPIAPHQHLGFINIFGDHFHPAILIVSSLMSVFPFNETVFIAMAIAYGLGGYFALLVGNKILKHYWLMGPLLVSYFLYLGTQHAFIFGFHEINLLPMFFFMALYGWFYKKKWVYWLSLLFLLMVKESMAVIGVALGIFFLLSKQKDRRSSIATIAVSIFYYLVATKIMIPIFSGGRFLYGEAHLPQSIPELIKYLVSPKEKITTFLVSMSTFGLLPLFNIATFPIVIQDFLVRYLISIPGNVQYSLGYHYGVGLAPLMLFASMWSVKKIEKLTKKKIIFIVVGLFVLANAVFFQVFWNPKGPLMMVFNKGFYQTTKNNAFLWELVKNTPKDGVIMAQSHLGLAYSEYQVVPLERNYKELIKVQPDYIAFDLRDGQNPNNYEPSTEVKFKNTVDELLAKNAYYSIYQEGTLHILKKDQEVVDQQIILLKL